MSIFLDLPGAKAWVPVTEIILSEDGADQPRCLTMHMQNYVLHLLQNAHYPLAAVPRDAVISAAVDYYICTVENGGHDAFVSNTNWDPLLREAIREGLTILALDELSILFAELEDFAAREPARFETADWSDRTIIALDDRFNHLPRDSFFDRHAQWIRQLPDVRILPHPEYLRTMKRLVARNRRRWLRR